MKLADVLERVNASDPGIALTILGEANIADASAAFYEGMRYVAGLDTNSIAMKKAEWEAKQDELKRKADERKARKAADEKAEAAEASEE